VKHNNASTLIRYYAAIYVLSCLSILGLCSLLVGRMATQGSTTPSPVHVLLSGALALLLMAAIGLRLHEFQRLRHIPGPRPSFFLGSLKSLLLHEHGARDKALLELHQTYGPVVKLHMAWGSRPFVSVAEVPKGIRQRNVDSNRRADGTVLPNSLMGLKAGDKHQAHREQLNPHFKPTSVEHGIGRSLRQSLVYLDAWQHGRVLHGSLKADLHHWSADSLGLFLCGEDWEVGRDLSRYLHAIATLEEAISFRAFHPFFVRWIFPLRSARAKQAYRHLFDFLALALARRLALPDDGSAPQDVLGKLASLYRESQHTTMPWTHEDCVEELMSLVAGGTDAMSYTVAQALVLLSLNPDVQQAAHDELRRADEGPDDALNPFMLNIVRETMRLFPAVPFSSKFSDDRAMDVVGMAVPARTNVMWMKTAVGQNSAIFHDAQRFAPDRFTASPVTGRKAESISNALPFGAGMRHCIGHHLAEALCTRFLTATIERFEVSAMPDVRVEYLATVSVTPSTVPVALKPRRPSPVTPDAVPRRAAQINRGRPSLCPYRTVAPIHNDS
jgi:cytochrome P450